MCGIFGTINKNINLSELKPHLLHRGPDAQTTYSQNNIQLHHFRLSILDIEGGVQPMELDDYVIIFNGEIYNHIEVRKKYNLQCHTNSDTETILKAFKLVGEKCFEDFDGMFAMAIYNKKNQTLFLCRDRAGKKPLYLYRNGNEIVFSSELNALAKTLSLSPNMENINMFFHGSFLLSNTAYNNVEEIANGHFCYINCVTLETKTMAWWNILDYYKAPVNDTYEVAENKIDFFLEKSVKDRIISSDLEVGAFLSGGIDSGLVVAKASKFNSKFKTFTVSFPGAYDESALANLVAKKYNTDHQQINIDYTNLKSDFEKIILNYGEPFFDSSAIPSYYVSKEARKHVTVVLNGDGADELFAGYRRYVPAKYIDFFNPNNSIVFEWLNRMMPIAHEKKSFYNYIYRLIAAKSQEPHNAYWSLTTDVFQDQKLAFTQPSEMTDNIVKELIENVKTLSPLHKHMAIDFEVILSGILLKKMDIATMAWSLEGRSPFLSKYFLEYVPTINPSFKISSKQTKFVLRNLAKKYLPSEIHHQPKRGFEIPLKNWINGLLSEIVYDTLNQNNLFVENFIHKNFIQSLLESKVNVSDEKRAKMIYQLLVTELWAKDKKFI